MRPPAPRSRTTGPLAPAVLLVALATTCAVHQSGWPPPVFPPGDPVTILPLREAVAARGLLVQATVRADGGRAAPVWVMVDSGASESTLPAGVAMDLGLPEVARSRSALPGRRSVGGGIVRVPELVLGDLVIRRLLVGTLSLVPVAILGQSVLRHAPWEVSWDRGTITLGATPWAAGAEVSSLPLRRQPRFPLDEIEIRINGHPIRMLLDTGASMSLLPPGMAATLGLPAVPFSTVLAGGGGAVPIAHAVFGDVEIGSAHIEGQKFLELPEGDTGLLGLDVLSRFELLIEPGRRLLIKPRGDLRATAAARIKRWSWIPHCASPACVGARISQVGRDKGQIELTIEAALPGAVELTLACAERPPGGPNAADPMLLVDLGGIKPGQVSAHVSLWGANWFDPQGNGCRELQVLDVVPLDGTTTTVSSVAARLAR